MALRIAGAGGNARMDYENLAEEIESLGKRDRRDLASRIATIIEHLLKLEFSPATDPRSGWIATVGRERQEIERVLEDSPSLHRLVPDLVATASTAAVRLVARELDARGEEMASKHPKEADSIPLTLRRTEILGGLVSVDRRPTGSDQLRNSAGGLKSAITPPRAR